MTTEEKYKEIVESRSKAEGDNPSGVKTDPPAKTPDVNTDDKPTEVKPAEGKPAEGKPQDDKSTTSKKEPTLEEKQQHAMAKMRADFNREISALRKENEELKAKFAGSKEPEKKNRKDFETDEAYGEYLRSGMKDSIKEELRKERDEEAAAEAEKKEITERITNGLEGIQKGLSEKIFKDLGDPYSEMSAILSDKRAKPIIAAIRDKNGRGADLLAIMQAKPQIFKDMLELPEKKMEYRIYSLEDAIDAKRREIEIKASSDAEKQERAASLPTAGSFGNQGNGTTDISGLSTEERVARYKAEMKKKRFH